MRISKTRDFIERVGWAALIAAASAALAVGFGDWELAGKTAAIAALVAALKVRVGQSTGSSGMGDLLPGGVEKREGP